MEEMFIFLYPLVSIISVVGYFPHIKKIIFSESDGSDIALSGWLIWILSSLISLGYGIFSLKDLMFCLTCGISLGAMLFFVAVVLYKRQKFRKMVPVAVV